MRHFPPMGERKALNLAHCALRLSALLRVLLPSGEGCLKDRMGACINIVLMSHI